MNKLLILRHSAEDFGGVEGQICRLAVALHKIGLFEPQLATSDKESLFAKRFASCGFTVHQIELGSGNLLRAGAAVAALVRRAHVCAIQTHLFRESIIGRLARRHDSSVKHIFRPQTYIDCSRIPKWKKNAYHLLDRASSHWVDKYIANGQYLATELIHRTRISPAKIAIVINGRASPAPPDLPSPDPERPLNPQVAMVANIFPGKGHDTLFRAMGLLKRDGFIIKARLVGAEATNVERGTGSPAVNSLLGLAKAIGITQQVEFYGRTDNFGSALQDYPITVLPSDSEGIPNCVLEAMSMRKLVLASAVGGIPELIEDGKSGLLFPPQDPGALAATLRKVFTTPARDWESMRTAAFSRWYDFFTMETMLEGYIRVYTELGLIH